MNNAHITFQDVGRHKTGYVDGIFCGPELRRVRQLQFFQVMHSHACLEGGSQDIDTLVHALFAHHLGPENLTPVRAKEQFYCHPLSPGIVRRMMI